MKILIVNDDGVSAPGLAVLREIMRPFGEVVVVAPSVERSACSHSITTQRPLEIERVEDGVFSVDATPADCVRIALSTLVPDTALVVSGINPGANLGVDIHFSGTAAGAREAAMRGLPAIAISQYHVAELDWELTAQRAAMAIATTLQRPWCRGWFWNLNLPSPSLGPGDPEIVECAPDPTAVPYRFEEQPAGGWQYRADYHGRERLAGHDVDVCFQGRISLSKIGIAP